VADIAVHSPVRDEAREVQAQPPRLRAELTHIPPELSDSPYNIPSCLTTRLQAGYPSKALEIADTTAVSNKRHIQEQERRDGYLCRE